MLIDNIKGNLANFSVESMGNKGYGETYAVLMELKGPNGRKAHVMTAWIDDRISGEIRLVSAYIKTRKG